MLALISCDWKSVGLGCAFVVLATWARAAGENEPALGRFPSFPSDVDGVKIAQVSSGRTIHRFFDTSPVSPSGRYLAVFRFPQETRSPQAGDVGDVVLVDLNAGTERVVAQSRGFEMQLGANVQWGTTDHELYFNDVDVTSWTAFAVQLDPLTGSSRRMGGTVFMASPDGRQLASYNLIQSRRAQVGYGVIVPEDKMPPRNIGPVDHDGVELTDVTTGKMHRVLSLREIYDRSVPSIAIRNPQDFEYYCFQVKWNPQGTRLLTTVQWSPRTDQSPTAAAAGVSRRRSVITFKPDGTDIHTAVTPEQWARGGHHVNWMPDGEHLSMNLDVDAQPGLELISVRYDGSDMKVIFKPGSGHPSMQPQGQRYFVTDAYPDEPVAAHDGTSPLRFINLDRQTEQTLAQVFVSMTAGEFRIDPHPAWDRSGRYVVFNGFVDHTRNVFMADLSAVLPAIKPQP
ncbi:MAG: hypothetical protein ABIZ04_12745 [Opitutus sp.]